MALYALASGFLNAYNRSEAAKKQAAAEQAKFEREQSTILAAEERQEARQKARDALDATTVRSAYVGFLNAPEK